MQDDLGYAAAADGWLGRDHCAAHPRSRTESTAYDLSHMRVSPVGPRPGTAHRGDHGGGVELERPYFYCWVCRRGHYPMDDVLGLSAGRIQLAVQQAAAQLVTELPYETSSTLLGDLSGIAVSSERMHTLLNQAAEGLTVLDVAPSREEIERRVAEVSAGRFRRPVLVLGIDGAYVPTRPEHARGRRPGQARQRARRALWQGQWWRSAGRSRRPRPGAGAAPYSDGDDHAEAESVARYWAAAPCREKSDTLCASAAGQAPHPSSPGFPDVTSGRQAGENRSRRPGGRQCTAPPAH